MRAAVETRGRLRAAEVVSAIRPTGVSRQRALTWLGLLLGFLAAWADRFAMNPDGVSYLDLGDDFAAGRWQDFVNAHWSPAYPALLGVTMRLFRPSPAWEFPAAHLVNFLIYAFALVAFGRLVRRLTAAAGTPAIGLPVVIPLYLLFFWAALVSVGLNFVTPDMLVLAAALVIIDLMLRTRSVTTWTNAVALGLALGVGYLCKAPLAWLTPVVIAGAFVRRGVRAAPPFGRAAVTGAVFVAVALPWVIFLSQKYGRPTLSESARLNWIWEIDRSAPNLHWQGGPAGTPAHATRIAQEAPRIYEFATPIGGTCPPWKDPTYWMEGAVAHIRPQAVFARVGPNLRALGRGLWGSLPVGMVALLLVAAFVAAARRGAGDTGRRFVAVFRPLWPLVLFGLAGIAMYLPVLVEMRYLAVFVLALMAALVAAAGPAWFADSPGLGAVVAILSCALFAISYAPQFLTELHRAAALSPWGERLPGGPEARRLAEYHVRVARELGKLGVAPGTAVGVMGEPALFAFWARLARVRIVAEMPRDQQSLLRDPRALARSLETFRRCGAANVFAHLPDGAQAGTPIGESGLVLFPLGDRN